MSVKFKEGTHQYFAEDIELISVSKFLEKFKPKVDWKEVAKRVAMKSCREGVPMTAEEVLVKWDDKRRVASMVGTLYHTLREVQLFNEDKPKFYGRLCSKQAHTYDNGLKCSIPINKLQNDTVYPELMIYDLEHGICGQSDKVIVVNNKIHIWDYKTDKEIKFKGFSNNWVAPKKMLKPIDHIDDCNGYHYALKMSLYMYMLWKANEGRFKPGDIVIEHVHLMRDSNNDDLPILENGAPVALKIEKIKLPYLKKEVKDMLKTIR